MREGGWDKRRGKRRGGEEEEGGGRGRKYMLIGNLLEIYSEASEEKHLW